MKTAVVLSGGGAKGAYQIGVWKALRKLHIKYEIVTGTSVGALNGALMVQNSYFAANKIWKNITYNDVFGDEFAKKLASTDNELDVYKEYAKSFFTEGGVNGNTLEQLFLKYINSRHFFNAKKDFGIVVFNSTTMKPLEVTKQDMKEDNFKDYILASASCYPALKPKKIDNQDYIDGGYSDNLPINLAIRLGAERVIAVDLRAPGFKRIVTDKKIDVIRIYPKNKLSSFLIFDKDLSKRAMKLGYNDTMKTFNKLEGNKFTFKVNTLRKSYLKYRNNIIYIVKQLSSKNDLIFNAITTFNDVNMILNNKDFSKLYNDIAEYIGNIYELDDSKIYDCKSFNDEILYEFELIGKVSNLSEKNMLDTKKVISYIYHIITNKNIDIKKITKIMLMFKKEFMAALYIASLEQ